MQPEPHDVDLGFLLDIDVAASRATEFVAGQDFAAFRSDTKNQSAVLFQLLVIGEAVKNLTLAFRAAHPSVEWKKMAGMRDRMIHDYARIRLDIVWTALETHLPELRRQIAPLLPPAPTD